MTESPLNNRRRIVILGGGFAGAYCAQELDRRLDGAEVEVVLLNRHNYFIFYPLLVETGVGGLSPWSTVVPIRAFCRRARFIMGELEDVDLDRQEVVYRITGEDQPRTLGYDQLVVALGSVTNLPPVPGLREHGYEMKSLAHAVGLRDRAIQLLEIASQVDDPKRRRELLTMVVVGGSFTGVEVAGEFNAYFREAARVYPRITQEDVRMVLIERGDRVLKVLDQELGDWAGAHLRRHGVELRLESSVTRIESDCCYINGSECIPTNTVIWCAGVSAPPIMQKVEVPRDRLGYILCERDGRVKGYSNVWGIGDCAVNPDTAGHGYPATAQHAVQEGTLAARNIVRAMRGRSTEPIDIKSKGTLAAFGHFDAVAKVGKLRLTGFPAWFLWRTAYLMKMPTWRKKLRVAWDWTADLLFPREYVELGLHRLIRAAPAAAREESQDPQIEHTRGQTTKGDDARLAEAPA
jgi:NADH:ubiquinone reductase (H+-translocating)